MCWVAFIDRLCTREAFDSQLKVVIIRNSTTKYKCRSQPFWYPWQVYYLIQLWKDVSHYLLIMISLAVQIIRLLISLFPALFVQLELLLSQNKYYGSPCISIISCKSSLFFCCWNIFWLYFIVPKFGEHSFLHLEFI